MSSFEFASLKALHRFIFCIHATSLDNMEIKGHLPLKEYFSLLSYQTVLLITSFLFLPRSSPWFLDRSTSSSPTQRTSADRPEHPFLTPLTASPLVTMVWDVIGTLVIMLWWGQHLKTWCSVLTFNANRVIDEKETSHRQERLRASIKVCNSLVPFPCITFRCYS